MQKKQQKKLEIGPIHNIAYWIFDKGLYPPVTLYVSLKDMQQAKIKIFSLYISISSKKKKHDLY